jgi:hypothetical protein
MESLQPSTLSVHLRREECCDIEVSRVLRSTIDHPSSYLSFRVLFNTDVLFGNICGNCSENCEKTPQHVRAMHLGKSQSTCLMRKEP